MQKSGKKVHDDMYVSVFKKHSTMWRDVLPRLQAKYEEDAQREQERRATELHGETSLARTNVDLMMVGLFAWELASFPPASEMSSTACLARRGSEIMAFVCFRRCRRRHHRLSTDLTEMCCCLFPHIGPKQSLLDLGGCRKFATTGRRSAGREDLMLFVFAMTQPLVACFRAVQPSPRELLQPGVAMGSLEEVALDAWAHSYTYLGEP